MRSVELAEWGLGATGFPAPVRAAAVRHLLDGFGAALAALRLRAADPAIEVAAGLGGAPEAAILGVDGKISAPAAALANGTLVHALDFDDTHAGGLVHATAVVLPAAFAVGQQVGATGAQVLDAAVVGYETVCRVAAAAPNGFHARGLHATMATGVFAAALVAARLTGLDRAQAVNALGIAGSQAGGLLAFLGTGAATKQLHPGFAAQAGLMAARLAAAGATGPETVFDGPHSVYDALTEGPVDPSAISAGLGSVWETTRIGIKPYPACQLSHATLDAVLDAREQVEFVPGDVDTIVADVHPDSAAVVCAASRDLTRPASPYAAKFSLPWSVAALVTDGRIGLDTFDGESIARPGVAALAARVRWNIVPAAVVAADAPGRVRITLHNGRAVVGAVTRSAGGPQRPLSRDALLAKLTGNAGTDTAELVARLESLDDQPDIDAVLAVVARTAAAARTEGEA
ncbi:MmgE/PrpD family protein [Dactylosporangium roseum]|uniref:MmgE/PrpD family protein n=1 Tax=Dactylosporangium roseum TaxID=47989 RepID=A0ABY5Z053_9ACTN|nr:MmgE/PrpD family protein [Dactylosporangium roseum]UWZ34257.1 MmgE/PrpD family protein [Dactylosporangium roseum]